VYLASLFLASKSIDQDHTGRLKCQIDADWMVTVTDNKICCGHVEWTMRFTNVTLEFSKHSFILHCVTSLAISRHRDGCISWWLFFCRSHFVQIVQNRAMLKFRSKYHIVSFYT